MNVVDNLCDSGLTVLVRDCQAHPIILQNETFCNDLSEADTLYKNAKFYYSTNEYQGALVSYSCTAVLLNSLSRQLSGEQYAAKKTEINNILNCCLRAVEVLFEKTKKMKKGNDDDEDGDKEWDKICTKIQPLVFNKGSSNCLFFSDVAGLNEEKKTFEASLIYPLMYPNLYPKRSKGILLYGPPGTGKTYIVKAAVNELQQIGGKSVGVLFFAPSPGDLKGKYVGETEKRIEEIFTCASRAACNHELDCKNGKKYISIIFMDEADAIAPDRDEDPTGLAANSVNTLLQMMDGINSKPNVAVIAATNFPWKLDNAILRRFDTQILVDIPKESDILELLNFEMRQMIQFKQSKSEYSYCEQERKKESSSSNKNNEQSPLKCNIECENIQPPELYMTAPYNKVKIDYYNDSSYVKGMVKKMATDNFSNSDISRLFKTAATNAGELAVKSNLFYSSRLIGYTLQDKFISCITKMKDETAAINKSIEIMEAFRKNQISTMRNEIYQLKKPDIISIDYNGHTYFNVKCLLYKSNELIIDHPLIKDVYIQAGKVGTKLDVLAYKQYILGQVTDTTSQYIDVIISFNFTFKETSIDNKEIPIFPASTNLINKIFKPIYNEIGTIKKNAEDTNKFKPGAGDILLKNMYDLSGNGVTTLLGENKLFDIENRKKFINLHVKKIIQSVRCDINAVIDGLVSKDFDFKFCDFDFIRFLLTNKVKPPQRNARTAAGDQDWVAQPDAVLPGVLDTYVSSIYTVGDFVFTNDINTTSQAQDQMLAEYAIVIFKDVLNNDVITMFNGTYFLIKIDDYNKTIKYKNQYQVSGKKNDGSNYFYTGEYPPETTKDTYIKIKKELFKILMRSSLGDNNLLTTLQKVSRQDETYPEFDKNNKDNIYFLKSEQIITQIFLNDIYNFMDLCKKLNMKGDKLPKTYVLFRTYIESLLLISSAPAPPQAQVQAPPQNVSNVQILFELYNLCCVRIFDNYNFVIKGTITDPANPTAGGGQEKKTQEEQQEHQEQPEQPSGGKKKFKLNKKHKQKYESKITKRYPHNKNTTKTKKNLYGRGIEENQDKTINMVGGAVTYEDFIKFCVNNDPSEYTTSKIADKAIFIATSYDITEVKRLRRNGLLNDVWYGVKSGIKKIATKLSSEENNAEMEKEEVISEMKDKNQYLPFIFKKIKAIGFLADEEETVEKDASGNVVKEDKTMARKMGEKVKILSVAPEKDKIVKLKSNKVFSDKDISGDVVKINWSNPDESGGITEMLKNLVKGIGQGVVGTAKAAVGISDLEPNDSSKLNFILNVIGIAAGAVTTIVLTSVTSLPLVPAYLATIIGSNIYNFVYANDVTKEQIFSNESIFNSITLSIILNVITDIRYTETKSFDKSANEIFSEAITDTISKISMMTVNIQMTGTTGKKAIETADVHKYTEPYSEKQEMQEKITNLNIPTKSFSYALTKVKTTYVKKTGEDLRLYKKNKDEFLEKRKKEKK